MRKTCRVCGSKDLHLMWDFGMSPLANSFKKTANEPEMFYPLSVYFCLTCENVQSGYVVDPDLLFKNYLYASSTSPVFVKHFEDFAREIGPIGRVIDIGSNDGILLKPFQRFGAEVLGVDPGGVKTDVPTIHEYFTREVAKEIGRADLVTCMNTFAHIDDLEEIVRGVKMIIGNRGVFVLEVQYLMDQMQFGYFDNVYHEHVQFWSVKALKRFFSLRGMGIINVEHIPTHGGSIRVYVQTNPTLEWPEVEGFIRKENNIPGKMVDFMKKIQRNKLLFQKLLYSIRDSSIVGYGAPAKSTTLLNYFGGREFLDYIVDDSPLKQGLYTPGTNVPIVNKLMHDPIYILILAWNFAESIMKNHPGYKYIIPCPKPRIV